MVYFFQSTPPSKPQDEFTENAAAGGSNQGQHGKEETDRDREREQADDTEHQV